MKVRNVAVALALTSAAAYAVTAMASYSSDNFSDEIVSAAGGSGQIQVHVDGDTVTLTGFSDDLDSVAAARAALNGEGIENFYNTVASHDS